MSFQEIQSSLQGVERTVQTAQNQLTSALEFVESARETLQGAADHSAQTEHAQAIALFQEAEAGIGALRTRLEQFHPAVESYLGSIGMNGASGDNDAPSPASSGSNDQEKRPAAAASPDR